MRRRNRSIFIVPNPNQSTAWSETVPHCFLYYQIASPCLIPIFHGIDRLVELLR
jgi:hypothetical protein